MKQSMYALFRKQLFRARFLCAQVYPQNVDCFFLSSLIIQIIAESFDECALNSRNASCRPVVQLIIK